MRAFIPDVGISSILLCQGSRATPYVAHRHPFAQLTPVHTGCSLIGMQAAIRLPRAASRSGWLDREINVKAASRRRRLQQQQRTIAIVIAIAIAIGIAISRG
jgi:hypothetical protein